MLTALWLAAPMLFAAFCLILAVLTPSKRGRRFIEALPAKIKIASIEFGPCKLTAQESNVLASVLACLFSSLMGIYWHATRDYGSLMPKSSGVEVTFDEKTIEASLALFPPEVLTRWNIDTSRSSWASRRAVHVDKIIAPVIATKLLEPADRVLSSKRFACTKATGITMIAIERLDAGVLQPQSYRLSRSNGELKWHESHCPDLKPANLESVFELVRGHEDNNVAATMKEVFFPPWSIYTKPRYLQIGIKQDTRTREPGFELEILTKLTFFPSPKLDNSIYLFRDRVKGDLVPIASATYSNTLPP